MSPADLMPAQIAEALKMLAEKDGVGIHVDTHKGEDISFHVVEVRSVDFCTRSGVAPTYAAALAACRAAEFSDGKERAK